jgi:hypothetical protein
MFMNSRQLLYDYIDSMLLVDTYEIHDIRSKIINCSNVTHIYISLCDLWRNKPPHSGGDARGGGKNYHYDKLLVI